MGMVLPCPLCGLMSFLNVSTLMTHIRLIHADDPNFLIHCNLQGCCRTYTNFLTYRNHVYAFHGTTLSEEDNHTASGHIDDNEEQDNSDMEIELHSLGMHDDEDSATVSTDPRYNLQKAAATWILKTREKHRVPLSVMDAIILDIEGLFQSSLAFLKERVSIRLKQLVVPEHVAAAIVEEIRTSSAELDLFQGLKSQHQQKRFFSANFNLVEPIQITLGRRHIMRGQGRRRRYTTKKECMVYVPVLKTLEVLLNNDGVLMEIERGHSSDSYVLKDYCDGECFQNHPLFSTNTKSLQILFYYDEVEICNPLGSSRGKHKLGMFYFLLGNLHPRYRSQTQVIQLVAICKNKYIKKYSMQAVMEHIMKDLRVLEQGHTFHIQGTCRKFYGTIAVVSADNPASAALGGFKESSSANRPCRQCMGLSTDMKTMFSENDFQLRTQDRHLDQLRDVEDDETGEKSKEYGINYRSSLLSLNYFDLCGGVLLPDIMHDILEGALQHELKLLLQHCVCTQHYVQLSSLSTKIESMEMGYMETDRPAPITRDTLTSNDSRLKQKAMQAWTLCRLIPFMIGDYVPQDDEHWLNYLLMLEITDYLFSPIINADEAAYLSVLIEEHNKEFSRLYTSSAVIPKMHNMIHMPRLILRYGPLVRHWTMRYESKHSYFKKLAQSIGNFTNVEITLAKRHQYLQCYQHLNTATLLQENTEVGPGMLLAESERPSPLQFDDCYRANWVKVNGIKYKKLCTLCIGVDPRDLPIFAKFIDVYMVQQHKPIAYARVYISTTFNAHYHAFEVTPTTEFKLVTLDYQEHPFPLHIRKLASGTLVVVPKYHIHKTVQSCYC